MEDLERCSQCHKLPEMTYEIKGVDLVNIILTCPLHGHMAIGLNIEDAKNNWNLYIHLLNKETVA